MKRSIKNIFSKLNKNNIKNRPGGVLCTNKNAQKVKIVLSSILSFCLLFNVSLFSPVSVQAQEIPTDAWLDRTDYYDTSWYDNDTSADTFEIENAQDLAGLAKLVNDGNNFAGKTVNLPADTTIDVSKHKWVAIGKNLTNSFKGTFDGKNSTITGIYIKTDEANQGLFGYVDRDPIKDGGTIKNVKVTNSSITSTGNNVGGIVGYVGSATIENCESSATVSGNSQVGGIVGSACATVTNCTNSGAVTGNSYVGGIVGYASGGTIKNCKNSATVSGSGYVGGIVGLANSTTVSGCTNKGEVKSESNQVGGIVGYVGSATIKKCENSATVTGNSLVGGIVGEVSSDTEVTDCTNTGEVKSESGNVGGIVGQANSTTVSGCTNKGEVKSEENQVGGEGNQVGGIAGLTIGGTIENCENSATVSGNGCVGGLVGLTRKVTVSACSNTGAVTGNRGVGGLVGYAQSTTVSGCYNTGKVSASPSIDGLPFGFAGGLVGYASIALSSPNGPTTVMNCYNTGDVSGDEDIGGLVGYAEAKDDVVVTISSCYNTGDISGDEDIGGLVGKTWVWVTSNGATTGKNKVTNCYNTGTVTSSGSNVGGTVGYAVDGEEGLTLENCFYGGYTKGIAGIDDADGKVMPFAVLSLGSDTIKVDETTTASITADNTQAATTALADANAFGQSFNASVEKSFTSSDAGVATVSGNSVTGVGAGTADISSALKIKQPKLDMQNKVWSTETTEILDNDSIKKTITVEEKMTLPSTPQQEQGGSSEDNKVTLADQNDTENEKGSSSSKDNNAGTSTDSTDSKDDNVETSTDQNDTESNSAEGSKDDGAASMFADILNPYVTTTFLVVLLGALGFVTIIIIKRRR